LIIQLKKKPKLAANDLKNLEMNCNWAAMTTSAARGKNGQ